jgi:hypothetical protein
MHFVHPHGMKKALLSIWLCEALPGWCFLCRDGELLHAVQTILTGLQKTTIEAVFLDWVERLQKYISTNGERTE